MSLINCINQKNKNKITGKQNYDYQQLFDVLLNCGQEIFSLADAFGNLTTKTDLDIEMAIRPGSVPYLATVSDSLRHT